MSLKMTVVSALLVVLICQSISVSNARDLVVCPDTSLAKTQVYDKEVATTVVGSSIRVRIPDSLFFQNKITCIIILDNLDSQDVPNIEEGGLNENYALISVEPSLTELLSFRIQVYTM
ncbi:uncharacterized protein LOC126888243 [Diabrotica virgifera virgifera]|uniref:Uncharacterized protein LOC114331909 n=1 Tax=Diabrotica virgifera virgifera TaxID=50390 RepID=A0A6P7FMB7_DIAVI|nr:uncharacterized protein LOC126888243 [Diabrotica virgifera virgifera]